MTESYFLNDFPFLPNGFGAALMTEVLHLFRPTLTCEPSCVARSMSLLSITGCLAPVNIVMCKILEVPIVYQVLMGYLSHFNRLVTTPQLIQSRHIPMQIVFCTQASVTSVMVRNPEHL